MGWLAAACRRSKFSPRASTSTTPTARRTSRKSPTGSAAAAFRCTRCTRRSTADYEWGRAGAPPVNIASTDRAARIEAMDEIKRALEIAEQIPFRFLVQHLGTAERKLRREEVRSGHDLDRTSAGVCQAARRAHSAGEYSQRTFDAGSPGRDDPAARTSTMLESVSILATRT